MCVPALAFIWSFCLFRVGDLIGSLAFAVAEMEFPVSSAPPVPPPAHDEVAVPQDLDDILLVRPR